VSAFIVNRIRRTPQIGIGFWSATPLPIASRLMPLSLYRIIEILPRPRPYVFTDEGGRDQSLPEIRGWPMRPRAARNSRSDQQFSF
jgi:hypothetical protein